VNGDGEPPDGGAPENMKLAPELVLRSSALLQNSTLISPFSPVNACHLAFVLTLGVSCRRNARTASVRI